MSLQYNMEQTKALVFHAYTKHYEKYFESMRNKPVKFLEIGFYRGSSAHMWEDYFVNGNLFFIDVNPEVLAHAQEFKRVHIDLVNQDDAIALNNFILNVGSSFDIIIDDGGHTMSQQITSFITLFPYLKSGGVYVIEDLHTSYPYVSNYAMDYGCANPMQPTAIDFLKTLIDCINLPGARTACADSSKCPRNIISDLPNYLTEIEAIHFYCSLVFIIKK